MPIYEYICQECDMRFEELRPLTRMDDVASCPSGHTKGRRVLSIFASLTRDAEGGVSSIAGSGCGGCSGGNCACSLN
jgi:putative FmdB family regulatory protein